VGSGLKGSSLANQRQNVMAGGLVEIPDSNPVDFGGLLGRVSLSYMLAALLIAIGMLSVWSWQTDRSQSLAHGEAAVPVRQVADAELPTAEREQGPVGRVVAMKDCRWADPSTATVPGASVSIGRKYALAAGLLEIAYDSGAKVTLEGPASFHVESAYRGYLSLGTATVSAEPPGEARPSRRREPGTSAARLVEMQGAPPLRYPFFSVRTSTASLIEQVARFTVHVSPAGVTYAHVLRGDAALYLPTLPGKARGKLIALMEDDWAMVEKYAEGRGRNINLGTGNQPATWVYARQAPKEAPVCSVENKGRPGGSEKAHN
jgi:hypothetical protein